MKKTTLIVLAVVMMAALCLPVFAQQFPDVPTDHWAYSAIQDLASKGIVQGYPDGTFSGKRALTRYEFAEALSKAIPVIAGMAGSAQVGPAGPAGPVGPAGTPGVGPEQIANLQRLMDEFKTELAAQGADIKALQADVAALDARVTAVENEQKRVVVNGEFNFIPRGFITNEGIVRDKEGVALSGDDQVLSNAIFSTDYQLGIKGKVSDDVTVKALIDAGNYNYNWLETTENQFTLWYAYMDAGVKMGPLGKTNIQAGRLPLQLTPYTLKLVEQDSYANVGIVNDGDFPLDGVTASFGIGKNIKVLAFGAQSAAISDDFSPAMQPVFTGRRMIDKIVSGDIISGISIDRLAIRQLAGARAMVNAGTVGNIGLTYYLAGLYTGRESVYGADFNTSIAKIGFNGEWAKTDPSDAAEDGLGISSDDSNAWNANLSYQFGSLGVSGGYAVVERNFNAPGYWSRFGRAVNLANVKGASANLNYNFGKNLSFVAQGQWLEPNQDSFAVVGREAIDQGFAVATTFDKVNYYKAGVKYALTASNSVDLGYEEVQWKPGNDLSTTKERYVTIGLGHSFNPNASLKLLYQIIEYKQGDVSPYRDTDADYRGGVAAAQFQLKY